MTIRPIRIAEAGCGARAHRLDEGRERIDEDADLGRRVLAAGEDGVDGPQGERRRAEEDAQAAVLDGLPADDRREPGDAHAGDRGLAGDLEIVDDEDRLDPALGALEVPGLDGTEPDAGQGTQRRPGRRAVAGEEARAGDEVDVALAEPAGGERGVVEGTDADGQVDPLFDQVGALVGEEELDADPGMAGEVVGHHRRPVAAAAEHGRRHAEQPGGLRLQVPDLAVGLVDLRRDGGAAPVVGGACLGDPDPAGGALDEPHAEPLLEAREPLAHRLLGDAQLARRPGAAALPDHGGEEEHVGGGHAAAAALDERAVPERLYVSGDRLEVLAFAEVWVVAHGSPLTHEPLGSLDELAAETSRRLAAEPANTFAWLPLMYARGVFGGQALLGEGENHRYPEIEPETVAQAAARGAV